MMDDVASLETLVQWDGIGNVGERRVVEGVGEKGSHGRGNQVVLVHGGQAEDLLDRTGHVDLRVVGVDNHGRGGSALDGIGADDVAGAAVAVDVVNAVLRVVFLDEDRRGGQPDSLVAS